MDRDVARAGGTDAGTPDAIAGMPNGAIESRCYVARDALGSVAAANENRTDPQQALVVAERFTYTAYGEVSAWKDAWHAANSRYGTSADPAQARARIRLPYLYTDQRLDAETGLYYYKNRYFDPARGRFLRRDLLGYGDGPNVYQYVGVESGRGRGRTPPLRLFLQRGSWRRIRVEAVVRSRSLDRPRSTEG